MERMVARRVEEVIASLLGEEQVLALQGPRAVGKTTLLRAVAASAGVPIVDLDDLATRSAVSADPGLFAAGEPPVCIDEFQKVPDILDAIKAELNVDGAAGRFVITHRGHHVEDGRSPHPRGCSRHARVVEVTAHQLLAPAGVFPVVSASSATTSTAPRTRGGLPAAIEAALGHSRISPHPRGVLVRRRGCGAR